MNTSNESIVRNEIGKATVWAMLISLCAVIGYVYYGQAFLYESVSPIVHGLAVIIISVFTLFSLGCGLHMALVGDRSNRQITKDIKNQIAELRNFSDFANEKIKNYETRAKFQMHAIRPIGLECLAQARRITQAILERAEEVEGLLSSSSSVSVIEADELFEKDLVTNGNSINSLIGADPIPPIAPDQWIPTVNRLLDKVEIEIHKVESQMAA